MPEEWAGAVERLCRRREGQIIGLLGWEFTEAIERAWCRVDLTHGLQQQILQRGVKHAKVLIVIRLVGSKFSTLSHIDQFVHLMGHTGNYSREEAIAEIEKERTLPDVLSFDPSKPAKYPNGRVFTDDVIDYRLAFLTKAECPPSGLKPHTDTLKEFPYIGTPHRK